MNIWPKYLKILTLSKLGDSVEELHQQSTGLPLISYIFQQLECVSGTHSGVMFNNPKTSSLFSLTASGVDKENIK